MSIKVICPSCDERYKVPDKIAGKKGKCPFCKENFLVPQKGEPASEAKKITAPDSESGATARADSQSVTCPHCDKSFKAKARFLGKPGKCPYCKRVFDLPELIKDSKEDSRQTKSASQGGMAIGKYKTYKILSESDRATIYRAKKEGESEFVALKVFNEEISSDKNFAEETVSVILTHKDFSHPNIVPIFEAAKTQKGLYYAMELLKDTQTLSAYRKEKGSKLPLETSLQIVKELAYGLEALHEIQVLHRDLYPDNILIDKTGMPRILEAVPLKKPRLAIPAGIAGNFVADPHYLSPEEATGDSKPDGRSDFYALGVIFFELLTGELPFNDKSITQLVISQASMPAPNPIDINSKIPKAYADIVLKMLEKKPDNRYQSATEFCDAIESIEGKDTAQLKEDDTAPKKVPGKHEFVSKSGVIRPKVYKEKSFKDYVREYLYIPILLVLAIAGYQGWKYFEKTEYLKREVPVRAAIDNGKYKKADSLINNMSMEYENSAFSNLFKKLRQKLALEWSRGNAKYTEKLERIKSNSAEELSQVQARQIFFEDWLIATGRQKEFPGFENYFGYLETEKYNIETPPSPYKGMVQLDTRLTQYNNAIKKFQAIYDPQTVSRLNAYFSGKYPSYKKKYAQIKKYKEMLEGDFRRIYEEYFSLNMGENDYSSMNAESKQKYKDRLDTFLDRNSEQKLGKEMIEKVRKERKGIDDIVAMGIKKDFERKIAPVDKAYAALNLKEALRVLTELKKDSEITNNPKHLKQVTDFLNKVEDERKNAYRKAIDKAHALVYGADPKDLDKAKTALLALWNTYVITPKEKAEVKKLRDETFSRKDSTAKSWIEEAYQAGRKRVYAERFDLLRKKFKKLKKVNLIMFDKDKKTKKYDIPSHYNHVLNGLSSMADMAEKFIPKLKKIFDMGKQLSMTNLRSEKMTIVKIETETLTYKTEKNNDEQKVYWGKLDIRQLLSLANTLDLDRPETCMIYGSFLFWAGKSQKAESYFNKAVKLDASLVEKVSPILKTLGDYTKK